MTKIPNDKLAAIYGNMMRKLNAHYTRGFYCWVSIFYKQLDKKLDDADKYINTTWEKCIKGEATLVEFIGAVNQYEDYMLKGYQLYKTRSQT